MFSVSELKRAAWEAGWTVEEESSDAVAVARGQDRVTVFCGGGTVEWRVAHPLGPVHACRGVRSMRELRQMLQRRKAQPVASRPVMDEIAALEAEETRLDSRASPLAEQGASVS